MIEDFTNPHGGLKPIDVVEVPAPSKPVKLRVVYEQGVYRVEQYAETLKTVGGETIFRKEWLQCHEIVSGKTAVYQTIQEAENFISRCLRPSKIYYY